MKSFVSVVIPVKDQKSRLTLTLAALEEQRTRADGLEVVIVDDASAEPVETWLPTFTRTARHPIRVVRCDSDGHRGLTRNLGARSAKGDILVFLDADACPGRELVERHRGVHECNERSMTLGDCYVIAGTESFEDPTIGKVFSDGRVETTSGVAPVLLPLDRVGRGGDEALLAYATKGIYPQSTERHRQLERALTAGSGLAWAGVIPHNLSMRRTTFEAVGGFDESLVHLEGWDFGIRAARTNVAFGWVPNARSFHLFHARASGPATESQVSAQDLLRRRYPEAGTDAVTLWWMAMQGDTYLPPEFDLCDLAAVAERLTKADGARDLRDAFRHSTRRDWTNVDYWLNATNSPMRLE